MHKDSKERKHNKASKILEIEMYNILRQKPDDISRKALVELRRVPEALKRGDKNGKEEK